MDDASLEEIIVRDFIPSMDEAYIYASWRNSSYYSSAEPIPLPARQFFRKKTYEIKEILSKPEASIKIACFKKTISVIAGYCVSRNTHLDFIYVKFDYRNKGVATLLMAKYIETVSKELTKDGKAIIEKKNLKVAE